MKLLLIEDDKLTARTIRDKLKSLYAIDIAHTGEDGEYQANINDYDVIIIDLVLPDTNGISLCKLIRDAGIRTPILILTGTIEVTSKVSALDTGADDYLTKPFSFTELLARLRALLRRGTTVQPITLQVGDLILNAATSSVTYRGNEIQLRRKEFLLLEFLMRNKGKVLTRTMILEHVWESDQDPLTNTVDVHINYLREKIDKVYGSKLIKTIHGLGYKIEMNK